MTLARQVYRRRLYQQIADDIERLILDGTYLPDSRLPSEQELAGTYGVSRNVIREALKSLKELGLISIRTGSGTYVRPPTAKPISEAMHRFIQHSGSGISFLQLYEARRIIEPDCTRLAAQRASDDDLNQIRASLQTMEGHRHDPEVTTQADLDFHLGIAAATDNPLMPSLLDPIIAPLNKLLRTSYVSHPFLIESGLEDHRRILATLQDHDADRAYQEMLRHLSKGERELLELGVTQEALF